MTAQESIRQAASLCQSVVNRLDDPAYELVSNAMTLLDDFDAQWESANRKVLRTWVKCAADWLLEASEKLAEEAPDGPA